jgi:Leucine-rich repeat (LRR) protein
MNAALPNLIANLSCLRTLKLPRCGVEEVPSNIGKLIHLRHVDFSWNEIRELPEEMCELYNMLTLDVSDCWKLERLPDNIGRLVKLRHLRVAHAGDAEWFVKMRGVEGLSSLRELDDFHVSGSDKESTIGDLRNLNQLRGSLDIRWLGDVKDPDEVKKAELKSKKHLTHLYLCFKSRTDREKINDDEVLEALELPPNLESLVIGDYQGIIPLFPGWINKLRVVLLVNWEKIENLPPLGKLPYLEVLTVWRMGCVGRVGREFLGLGVDSIGEMTSSSSNTIIAFPKLKSLSFRWMGKWEEWERGEGGNEDKTNISISTIIMPSLRSLKIMDCPKLKALPDYVLQSTTLEQLTIRNCPIIEAQFKAGGKGWPNASHTPNIRIN